MSIPLLAVNEHNFPPLPSQRWKRMGGIDSERGGDSKLSEHKHSVVTIDDLPDELIADILDYLPKYKNGTFQLATLANLSLTSHRLHRMVTDRLYANYNSRYCQPYLFLRTIISNPHLAALVRHVDISTQELLRRRYLPTAQDKKIIKEGMKKLQLPEWKAWATDCNTAVFNITLHSAVLLHTPRITSLIQNTTILDPGGPNGLGFSRRITSFEHTHKFKYLQSVHMEADQLTPNQLVPLFRLQSLRRVFLSGLVVFQTSRDGEQNIRALQRIAPSCNNIEELHLKNARLHKDALQTLVTSSRKLKRFLFSGFSQRLSHKYDEQSANAGSGYTRLSIILGSQVKSLECLDLWCYDFADGRMRGDIYLHEDLRDFVALKRLSCPLNAVIDARLGASAAFFENLPSSLLTFETRITTNLDYKFYLNVLEHADYSQTMHLSQMKEVKIVVPTPIVPLAYDWERLVQQLSGGGIALVVEQKQGSQWIQKADDSSSEETDADLTESSQSSDEFSLYSDDGSV